MSSQAKDHSLRMWIPMSGWEEALWSLEKGWPSPLVSMADGSSCPQLWAGRWVRLCVHVGGRDSCKQELTPGPSLVGQWLRIRLPMQGTRVRSLVQEDPTCRGATKPVTTTTEFVCHNY